MEMKVFCSAGSDGSDAAIFQGSMIARLAYGSSDGKEESIILRSGSHDLTNSSPCNGNISCPAKKIINFVKCNNNNNDNNNDNTISHGAVKTDGTYINKYPCEVTQGNISGIEASPRMKELLLGLNEPGDSQNPPEPPKWLDRELFDRGRKFYRKYLFCIFFSDLLSLLMMFSVGRILRPLIYTDRSDTPTKALKRYVSTIMHIIRWFTGDVWDPNDPAHKDILSIRSIHNKSADTFNSSKHYDRVQSVSVKSKGHLKPRCPFSPAIRQDLHGQAEPGFCFESSANPAQYISQWDMAVTQYSFLGIVLAHPAQVGAWWVTEKDCEGLVHFWRGLGWLLGIEEKYNFCNGTAAETRALCLEMEQLVMVPNLSVADWNHEHMSTSLIKGINNMVPGLSYPAMFRFLADTLGLKVPTFTSQMGWHHTFQYWLMRFVFHILFLIPGVIFLFNELLKLALRTIQNQNPAWLAKSKTPVITVTPYDDYT